MKRLAIYMAVAAIAAASQSIRAQEPVTDTEVQQPVSEIQQLRQEMEELKQKMHRDSVERRQEKRQERMWKKSKPIILYYEKPTLTDKDNGLEYQSNWGAAVSFGRTFDLHSKAIAGMIKFGLDVRWVDLGFTQYAKGKGVVKSFSDGISVSGVTEGTYGNAADWFQDSYDHASDESTSIDFDVNAINVGKWNLSVGLAGFGPSVRIAPFYPLGKAALDNLKIGLYFHYVPTFQMLLFTGDNQYAALGYMGRWRYGVNLTYKRIGIGVEHYWGTGKLKRVDIDNDDEETVTTAKTKSKYAWSSTRFYIGFRF